MMDIALIIPVLRQLLQIIGGALIARGWLDDAGLDAMIGVVVNAAVFVWWLIDHYKAKKAARDHG